MTPLFYSFGILFTIVLIVASFEDMLRKQINLYTQATLAICSILYLLLLAATQEYLSSTILIVAAGYILFFFGVGFLYNKYPNTFSGLGGADIKIIVLSSVLFLPNIHIYIINCILLILCTAGFQYMIDKTKSVPCMPTITIAFLTTIALNDSIIGIIYRGI